MCPASASGKGQVSRHCQLASHCQHLFAKKRCDRFHLLRMAANSPVNFAGCRAYQPRTGSCPAAAGASAWIFSEPAAGDADPQDITAHHGQRNPGRWACQNRYSPHTDRSLPSSAGDGPQPYSPFRMAAMPIQRQQNWKAGAAQHLWLCMHQSRPPLCLPRGSLGNAADEADQWVLSPFLQPLHGQGRWHPAC